MVPFPEPVPPDAIVMNDCCGVAVHEHPAGSVTATENWPPLKVTGTVAGAAVGTQLGPAVPACVTETVRPATSTVPDRESEPVFAAIEKRAVPGVFPEPITTEMKAGDWDEAVHVQPEGDDVTRSEE